jgi:hypothetical protein
MVATDPTETTALDSASCRADGDDDVNVLAAACVSDCACGYPWFQGFASVDLGCPVPSLPVDVPRALFASRACAVQQVLAVVLGIGLAHPFMLLAC